MTTVGNKQTSKQVRDLLKRRKSLDTRRRNTMLQSIVLTITLNPSPDGKGHIPSVNGPIMNWPLCLEMLDLGKQCIMQHHSHLIKEQQRGIVAAPANALQGLPEPANLVR